MPRRRWPRRTSTWSSASATTSTSITYYPGPADRVDRTGTNGDGDVQTLAEFREKYHFYQADEDLQALHAAHPWVTIWDDHEVEDNYAGDEADSAQPNPHLENSGYPRRVPFERRRRNGYKAYFEAHPRLQQKGMTKNQIYGIDPARRARRAVPHRPAPVPRPAALRGRHPRSLPRRRGSRPHIPRRRSEEVVQEGGSELERQVEAVGQRADGDERRRPGRGRRRSSTPGTATRPSAARSSPSGSRRTWRTSSS